MSVIGIGTDIVDVRRIRQMADQPRKKLAKRVLTALELQQYHSFSQTDQAAAFLAKRWAAKEAVAKALGTGIAAGISFQHIVIKNLASGQPMVELFECALEQANTLGATQWHVSISDEQHYATSFVVLSK
jgi:holo-[acyl-carrier protein] synthase